MPVVVDAPFGEREVEAGTNSIEKKGSSALAIVGAQRTAIGIEDNRLEVQNRPGAPRSDAPEAILPSVFALLLREVTAPAAVVRRTIHPAPAARS